MSPFPVKNETHGTPGNVDDRKPVLNLCKNLFGKLIADRGYISQSLFEQLWVTLGVQLITKLKKNMKNRLLPLLDKLLLRKRAIIESMVHQPISGIPLTLAIMIERRGFMVSGIKQRLQVQLCSNGMTKVVTLSDGKVMSKPVGEEIGDSCKGAQYWLVVDCSPEMLPDNVAASTST